MARRYRIRKEFGIWWFWDRENERVVTWSPSLEWCLRNGEKELIPLDTTKGP